MIDPLLIILAAPYTQASRVSSILGKHPEMYALPDINLFVADDIAAVVAVHAAAGNGFGDGLLRLVAQMHLGEQNKEALRFAEDWLREHEKWTTREFLDYVHEGLQSRLLIDASPSTVMSAENLGRMQEACPSASFLHLVNHPRTYINYINGSRSTDDSTLKSYVDSADDEMAWYRPNNLISEFAMSLPEGQCMRLMVEDLLANPENYLLQIAQWLDVSTDSESISAMLHHDVVTSTTDNTACAQKGTGTDVDEKTGLIDEVRLGDCASSSGNVFSKQVLKLGKEYGYR